MRAFDVLSSPWQIGYSTLFYCLNSKKQFKRLYRTLYCHTKAPDFMRVCAYQPCFLLKVLATYFCTAGRDLGGILSAAKWENTSVTVLHVYANKAHLLLFPLFRVKGEKQLDIFWYSCKIGRKKPKSKTVTEFVLFSVKGIAFPMVT